MGSPSKRPLDWQRNLENGENNLKILQLQSNFIKYRPIETEAAVAEEASKREQTIEDVVVLFTSIEEGDDNVVAREAVREVASSLEMLRAKRILIYPYAHLSSNLARPAEALSVLKKMEQYAKESGIETTRAPFGWTKQFTISIKGHPLAEQLRVITPGKAKEREKVSEALKGEEKLKPFWYVLQPDGKLTPVKEFSFANHETLEKLAKYEIAKVRAVQQMPPHVTLMRRLEIADYEPGSDPGNFKWYPKGRLIKSLLEEYVSQKVTEYGAMEVETPIMYDFQHPSLASYLNRFPARQYTLRSEDKELFLRFSACFGQFLMAHGIQFSYRQLPLRIYELTRYSFRREKSGELVGLRRLRAFTMPDCHAMCADLDHAKEEFLVRFKLSKGIMEEGLELGADDYELAIRFTKDFYEQNRDFVTSLTRMIGKPALVEMWMDRFFYFILKWEFNFIDNLDKASALSTDQIDIENAERYGITYVDEKAKRKYPLILHCSPSGAIERCIYALLEKAYRDQKRGEIPIFPLWLSPVQVRLIPISDKFVEDAKKIANVFEQHQIRVDLDDRALTMQKKVREAETEWVNYVLVIGQQEILSDILQVRDRKAKKIRKMQLNELVKEIKEKTDGKPFKQLTLPKLLSNRPQFVG